MDSPSSRKKLLTLLKAAVDCLPIGITVCDTNGKIVYTNPAEAEMHGYMLGELIGWDASRLAPPYLKMPFSPEKMKRVRPWRRESINVKKAGEEFPVQLTSVNIIDDDGECLGTVTACEEITSRKEAERRIWQLAYYDNLTGLPNRRTFHDRLQLAMALAHREGRRIGLLFLDLDNFKDVNDTQGHDFGDKLIREVAARLGAEMRDSDTLARLGGDEFVVALTTINGRESAAAAAERVLSLFSQPFAIDGRKVYSGASVGIAIYPDDGQDVESIFKCADTAMYHAKNDGKSNYRFFSAEMNLRIMHRVALESSLRQGMENEEFHLLYQPQWDLATSRVIGAEALLRWQSEEFGLLLPAEFVPLAENSGQILSLGEWALQSACRQAKEWSQTGFHEIKVGVNISGQQFRQPDFPEVIARVIRESGIAQGVLELEFTESVIMANADKTIETFRSLKKMGVRLCIDNFGTGYSSLSYLKHFPIDRIKIDRSFIADVNHSNGDATIVEAIISMAHSLNLKVTAKGVENSGQLRFLASRNCDEAQGFHLAMPMPAEDFTDGLKEPQMTANPLSWPIRQVVELG
ncbi:MAG TPA: EAL domain-containing protein [Geobacteraceae bacterium]